MSRSIVRGALRGRFEEAAHRGFNRLQVLQQRGRMAVEINFNDCVQERFSIGIGADRVCFVEPRAEAGGLSVREIHHALARFDEHL